MPLVIAVLLMALLACLPAGAAPASVSAADFGAVGDGKTDAAPAIQRALEAVAHPGLVHLPAGSYMLSAGLRVPDYVTLLGEGARWENNATRLIVPSPGFPAVRLGNGSGVKALAISYPNNQHNAHPVPYPPAIQLEGINPSVEQINFDAAWIGVATAPGGRNAGQGMFRELTGFVHHTGMHLSGCRDVGRILDVHWFVGGKDTPGEVSHYRKERVGFEFGDVDGVIMERCFIIGGKTFLHQLPVKDTPDGSTQPAHSLGFHIDQCWIEDVDAGFVFEGACGFVLSGTNILVRKGGVGVWVAADSLYYNAVITGVQVRPFAEPIVGIEYRVKTPHPRNRLAISDCQVINGAPAVHLGPGAARTTITGCHLNAAAGQPAVLVDEGADLFTISGNVLSGKVEDHSGAGARKRVEGNVVESE